MDDIAFLRDVEEIKRLKAKYFYYLDTKDWNGWREQVFLEDSIIYSEEMIDEPLAGISSIIEFVEKITAAAVTVHHGHTPNIEFISTDVANGTWAMEDRIYWSADQPYQGIYSKLHGFGYYRETYLRRSEGWRIKDLSLKRIRVEMA